MLQRLLGLLIFIAGLVMTYMSFHADEYGLGQHQGVGEDQMLWTLFGLAVTVVGGLILVARSSRR